MKKILAAALIAVSALSAQAQGMYDALTYADINYYGTARTIGMGNAVAAVGGDLGSVGINPAGSAVSSYSQFTITPNISIGSVMASYAPVALNDFTADNSTSRTRFTMPNLGLVTTYRTGNSYGLKRVSIGLLSNSTNIFNDRVSIRGINDRTSMLGAMAARCDGIAPSMLNSFDSGCSWPDVLGYKTGLIATFDDALPDSYIGSTELILDNGDIVVGGPLDQSYFRQHSGSKNDIIFNLGMDFSDKFFLGFNLGVPSLSYSEYIGQVEEAVDPSDFRMEFDGVQTAFEAARQRFYMDVDGTGIYGKIGLIWLPVTGLRIGLAAQTPTLMTITERWHWDALCQFERLDDNSLESPYGDFTYDLVTPAIYTAGLAYTLGNTALFSVDFERSNAAGMRFMDSDPEGDGSGWYDVNREIQKYAGATNALRAGVEYKIIPELALRAGYNIKTYKSPEFKDVTSSYSFGAGYSSSGSFFADLALRNTIYPESWYYPYDDYLDDLRSPEVRVNKNIFDVVLTLGWRF